MTELSLITIFLSSLAGSWHCAGMCGPFALMATQGQSSKVTLMLYHVGKLLSYFILVSVVFMLSQTILEIQTQFNLQYLTTALAIILLLIWAHALIFNSVRFKVPKFFSTLLRRSATQNNSIKSFSLGFISGLIPCIWLYGFIGLTGSQANYGLAILGITVFWLGTLPSLIVVQLFATKIKVLSSPKFKRVGATLLVLMAFFTLYSRSGSLTNIGGPEKNIEAGTSCHH